MTKTKNETQTSEARPNAWINNECAVRIKQYWQLPINWKYQQYVLHVVLNIKCKWHSFLYYELCKLRGGRDKIIFCTKHTAAIRHWLSTLTAGCMSVHHNEFFSSSSLVWQTVDTQCKICRQIEDFLFDGRNFGATELTFDVKWWTWHEWQ